MRLWWLVGLFALGGCDETPERPNPFRFAPSLGGGGSSSGITSVAPRLPVHDWNWTACGTIPRVADEPVFAIPLSGDATAVGFASGGVQLYRGNAAPIALRNVGLGPGEPQFSPDGTIWADFSGSLLRLRSAADGSVVRDVLLQDAPCGDRLSFAPDSRHVVLSALPATCVIDVETGAVVTRIEGAYGPAGYDNGRLVAGADFTKFVVFDVTGQPVDEIAIPVEAAEPRSSILSPKGDRLARMRQDGELVLYDLLNGGVLKSIALLPTAFEGAVFSPDGELVLMGDRVLATADGTLVSQLPGLPGRPSRAALSNDGRRATFWGAPDDAHHPSIVDLTTGQAVRVFGGHSGLVRGIAASPDGTRFATSSGQGLLAWRLGEPFEASVPEWVGDAGGEVYAHYSADSELLAVSGQGRAVFTAGGRRVFAQPPPSSKGCPNAHFAFSKDGRWLAGGGGDYVVDVFDAATQQRVAQLPTSGCNSTAAFSPDGAFLVTGAVEIYRTQDWSRVTPENIAPRQSSGGDAVLDGAVFMPDGRELLVSRCGSGAALSVLGTCTHQLWTVGGRAEGIALPLPGALPDFSPEGDWLVAANQLLELGTQQVRPFAQNLTAAAFLPNGDLIGGGADGTLTRYCRSE